MKRQKKRNYIKTEMIEYIDDNIQRYIVITIMFLIGIVLGIIFVNNTNKIQIDRISNYINSFIETAKSNYEISKIEVLKNSILSNLYITLLFMFLGTTVIGMPLIYIAIIYKGYSLGYTIASIVATVGLNKGIVFIIFTMLLKYIIYIPCILSLAVNGIKFRSAIVEDRRRDNIKIQIIRYLIFTLFIFIILVIASIIETYISSGLTMWLIKKY